MDVHIVRYEVQEIGREPQKFGYRESKQPSETDDYRMETIDELVAGSNTEKYVLTHRISY